MRIWLRNEINRDRIRVFFYPDFDLLVDSLTVPDLKYSLPKTPRYPNTENEWHQIKYKLWWSWILSVSHLLLLVHLVFVFVIILGINQAELQTLQGCLGVLEVSLQRLKEGEN